MNARAHYALDNADPQADRRFDELETLFDAPTTEYLTALGVSRGWSCWELGAGSGSIARWLADVVGETGSVLATDLDLRWLRDERRAGLTARVHDVVNDDFPQTEFDLIHARLVLVHLPERERVLSSLVRSLRPGGWILIEDFDQALTGATEPTTAGAASVLRIQHAMTELLVQRGADLTYARRLPDLLRGLGLSDVAGQGRLPFAAGGSAASRLLKANYLQVGDQLVDSGLCTRAELDAALDRLDDPGCGLPMSMMVSAWGRRPPATKPAT